jgi:hypothetical protein
MASRKVSRLAPAVAKNEPRGDLRDLPGGRNSDTERTEKAQAFVDRFGHLHSASVFKNWSPAAIRAMGIRPIRGRRFSMTGAHVRREPLSDTSSVEWVVRSSLTLTGRRS